MARTQAAAAGSRPAESWAGSVPGSPEGIALPSTATPFAGRSSSATMVVSRTRATNAPGILGAYRFISRTIRKAPTPIATEYKIGAGDGVH